jgi:hypothetical protein
MSGAIFFVMTMFLLTFSGMIVQYGISNTSVATQLQTPINCVINNLPISTCAFPTYSPPTVSNATTTSSSKAVSFPECLLYIPSCFNGAVSTITNVGSAIWNGLQQVAYALAFANISVFIFFNKMLQTAFLFAGILGIINQGYGIPFITYFFLGFFIFYIMYGISMLKPGGSGLPG